LHEDLSTVTIISRSTPLIMRNVSDKSVEKIVTHILYSITFFSKKSYVYGIMWKNLVQPDR